MRARGAVVGGYLYERHRTGSIYHPHARFVAQPTPTLPTHGPERVRLAALRVHAGPHPLLPRLRRPYVLPSGSLWVHNSGALLEFPPVIYGNHLFQIADDAVLIAIDTRTGRAVWSRRLGQLSASSPAVTANSVYVTILSSGHRSDPGRVIALNSATGAIRWWRALSSPSESSSADGPRRPVHRLPERARLRARRPQRRRHLDLSRRRRRQGEPDASPDGVLYFGDYSGHVQAVSEHTGRPLWVSSSEGALLGSGTFYSTAAVVYGRVFLGNTDGRVYAYDASTGRLDWAVQTGAYVYASPAVTSAPGIGPTVYLGSYNGTFYALNARSGKIAWHFNAHGRISGSATIVGRVVYFADLGQHRTYGLGISTGRVLFEMGTGAFDPVISDGTNLYLTGYSALYGLRPD